MFFENCSALFRATLVNLLPVHFPIPFTRPSAAERPALVRIVSREDVQWNRPVFKAPPLAVQTPVIDATLFASDLSREVSSVR